MYTTKEIFADNGCELKEILKSCIYNYYLKYKEQNESNELQKSHFNRIIETSNEKILLDEEGNSECTVSTIMTI